MAFFRRVRDHGATVIVMDDTRVRKVRDDVVQEEVVWDALTAVEILTTSDGPLAEDMFWVLHGAEAAGIVVPAGLAPPGFLERLQALPGFDNEAVAEASGSTSEARFPCWGRLHG